MQTNAWANVSPFEQSSIAKRLDAVDRAQVADDFGKHGRAWRGSDCEIADLRRKEARFSVSRDLMRSGTFSCEGFC
jgi:hypothetical protein